jgi:transposase-like protein
MCWYLAYPLSLRYIDEMMHALGVFVGYAKVHRWSIKVLPVIAAIFHRNHTVCRS